MSAHATSAVYPLRRCLLLLLLAAAAVVLAGRAMYLHVFNKDFLQNEGAARHLRVVTLPAHRGLITDRHGEPLAVSTAVDSIWANPKDLMSVPVRLPELAALLDQDIAALSRHLAERGAREFVYLKRHVSPELAGRVMALKLPGVDLQREYRRFYPSGEVSAHVLGFTNIDDIGQEGLELAYQDWLKGEPGAKRAIKDGLNRIVADVESLRAPRPGKDLVLALDRRLQYLTYRELKAQVLAHRARAGAAVVLDVATGEVLAMADQPAYNPNRRVGRDSTRYRNRALTDVFEPGSTLKPFIVALALESGRWQPASPIDTAPGYLQVGRKRVTDIHNYGLLDVTGVIAKSSNVGVTKIALAMPPEGLWSLYRAVGFGALSGTGFPGEATGILTDYRGWDDVEYATHAFGYGLSVTPLQLAQAYTVLASDGVLRPTSLLKLARVPAPRRVLKLETVQAMRGMLELAVGDTGTGKLAQVPGYRVAGKTGTVRVSTAGGYSTRDYISVFAGMIPASHPRLVMAVMIVGAQGGEYYGGLVAAPVFGRVMASAMRLLDIAPDALPAATVAQVAARGTP